VKPEARAESDALHARVRRYARAALRALDGGSGPDTADTFERLALEIAAFQTRHNPVVARLAARRPPPATLLGLPAVAADVFRLARVAAHAEASDVARFQTSGTTGGAGVHVFRTLDTYRELSVEWGRRSLLPASGGVTVLALAPPFAPERRSSLGFMMQAFIETFSAAAAGADAEHWLLGGAGLDLALFERGVSRAHDRSQPVLLLATSFALVWLLEALGERRVPLPPGSVVMHTGGFKGKARELSASELVRGVCRALALEPRQLVGEYGMTELSSQLYDRGFTLDAPGGCGSVFVAPPWLEVIVVDPVTLAAAPAGELGLARFVDLANVDSALVIQTQDRVRRVPGGIELHGRQPGAVLRGCSLATEELAELLASGSS
jgi:hypothetical protein